MHSTVISHRSKLRSLCRHAHITEPHTATEAQLVAWIAAAVANNSARARIGVALSFLGWCQEQQIPTADLTRIRRMKRSYPKTYGKAQAPNPARWLTHDQAFGALLAACDDGTLRGLRDELVIRFGLSGMRRAEIAALTFRNIATLPTVEWTGKGNRPRKITAGPALLAALARWTAQYPDHQPDSPVICITSKGRPYPMAWGEGFSLHTDGIYRLVRKRAHRADLGHVAPHDLRRSAASILHTATTDDGAHRFDLLDIQKVLGHADPATTMRSYLDPMDTGVLDRAAAFLD